MMRSGDRFTQESTYLIEAPRKTVRKWHARYASSVSDSKVAARLLELNKIAAASNAEDKPHELDFPDAEPPRAIRRLNLHGCDALDSLDGLRQLPALESLGLRGLDLTRFDLAPLRDARPMSRLIHRTHNTVANGGQRWSAVTCHFFGKRTPRPRRTTSAIRVRPRGF